MRVDQVDESHLMDYIETLKAADYASSSIARQVIAIKVLCLFLKREGKLTFNFAFYVETPKVWQLIPDILSYEEVKKLLHAPNVNTLQGSRYRPF